MYHILSNHWYIVLIKRLSLFVFTLILGFPVVVGATSGDGGDGAVVDHRSASMPQSPTQQAAYQNAVTQVMEAFHIPGAVAGVWIPGHKAWKTAQGLGDVRSSRPITLDDHFPIRSVTKSFTVTLILQLVRAGKLSLDDPINKYVPGIPNGDTVTLTQLAAMESGVKNYTEVDAFLSAFIADLDRHWIPREIVDFAIPESPVFVPGAQYDYSNTNTILLGMVVEAVTKRPLARTYQKRIFNPLGLVETSYPDDTAIPDPHPAPYEVDPVTGNLEELPLVNLSALGAAGGIVSTLDDLRRWGRALGTGRFIGRDLQQIRLQHSRPATNGPEYDNYGLGIGQLKGWWGHTGEALGYQAATFYDPQTRAVIAVAVNSSQPVNVATEIFKALADVVHPTPAAQ